MKNIVLCPNKKRDIGLAVTGRVQNMLSELGLNAVVCPLGELTSEVLKGSDAIITFGGDGTILHAARAASVYSVPLLGVNMGHKGFIAELEADDLDLIKKLASGDYSVERRMMTDVTVTRRGETVYSDFALNDIFVGGMARVVDIAVYGDNRRISAFAGDGIVVATPTGSTAYSLSAGGPIVEPDGESIIVTPICPHVLWAKAYVLTASRVVTVELGELGEKVAYISTDGSDPVYLEGGDRITVARSERVTRLIKLTDKSFYERVSEKLGEKQ